MRIIARTRRALRIPAFCIAVTLALAGCSVPPDVTGTWIAQLPIGSDVEEVVLQLHQRRDGSVIGYVLGGTCDRTIVSGQRSSEWLGPPFPMWWNPVYVLELQFEFRDPQSVQMIDTYGLLLRDGDMGYLFGNAQRGGSQWTVGMLLDSSTFHEKQFIFGTWPSDPDSEPFEEWVRIAVVLDDAGDFVSGSFVGGNGCDLFGCGGVVTAYTESGISLEIRLRSTDSQPGTAHIIAWFDDSDPDRTGYGGLYEYTDYNNTTTGGNIAGGLGKGTTTDHVADILADLGQIGDDLERGITFSATYPPLDGDYQHWGQSHDEHLDELNGQIQDYDAIQVNFSRIRNIHTEVLSNATPQLVTPFSVDLDENVTGVPAGGTDAVVIRDFDSETCRVPQATHYSFVREVAGRWVISGNGWDEFDLPFEYEIGPTTLRLPDSQGPNTLFTSIGGFGAHVPPLTGHSYGDAKSNLEGYPVLSQGELVQLDPVTETYGFYAGTQGEILRDKIPSYISPYDGVVTHVIYLHPPNPDLFDSVPEWNVRVRFFDGDLQMHFEHIGQIVGPLLDRILNHPNLDVDPDTYSPQPGEYPINILEPFEIQIHAGEAFARPVLRARELDLHSYYYTDSADKGWSPWVQMEFNVLLRPSSFSPDRTEVMVCVYELLNPALKHQLQLVLDADMADPNSIRYSKSPDAFLYEWQYGAEGCVCNAITEHDGGEGIYRNLGGWIQRQSLGGGTQPDEIFAIVPIQKGAASYDQNRYSLKLGSTFERVDYLVVRSFDVGTDEGSFSWIMPDGLLQVWNPVGEVLTDPDPHEGEMLIKWRDIGWTGGAVYQRAYYVLSEDVLKVRWGPFSSTYGPHLAPIQPGEACNDTDLICYVQEK